MCVHVCVRACVRACVRTYLCVLNLELQNLHCDIHSHGTAKPPLRYTYSVVTELQNLEIRQKTGSTLVRECVLSCRGVHQLIEILGSVCVCVCVYFLPTNTTTIH